MADRVETSMVIGADDIRRTVEALTARHGAEHAGRIRRGVEQVAQRWWAEDGDAATFAAFCEQSFVAGPEQLAAVFRRLQDVQEQVDGPVHEIRREVMFPVEVDTGDLSPLDQLLADFDLAPQIDENLFKTKVAFLALLNFPVHSLAERLEQGGGWSREEWPRSRMTDRSASRVPAAIAQEVTRVANAAERYVSGYNIRVDRLVLDEGGERLFPEGLRLISHWGLRDELASHYVTPDGLTRQRAILRVMERIVRQEIPAAVVDNPRLTWNPFTNEVRPVAGEDAVGGGLAGDLAAREPDTRYAHLLDYFR